ncbi:MAG: cell division protein ZapA [Syntrophales bacterium]
MKKRFNIKVLGQEFSVLSDTGDDHVANIVQYVNGKAEEIGRTSKNATTLNIAILVALNIADEYFRFKGEKETIFNQLENESRKLIHYIEERM